MAYDAKTHINYIAGLPYYFLWIGHAWNVYVYKERRMYKLGTSIHSLKNAEDIANNHANNHANKKG